MDPALSEPLVEQMHLPCALQWGVVTDVGCVRQQNEDAYAMEPEAGLFLVTDGMGGHRGGELASAMIAQDLPPALETAWMHTRGRGRKAVVRLLRRIVGDHSRQLRLEGHSETGCKGMGATLALVWLLDKRVYLANVGDSRIYRWRQGRLRQLSRDHSVVAELIEDGQLHPDEAEAHEENGVITRYIGMDEQAKPCVRSFGLKAGDRMLLCTDGLTDMVSDEDIAIVLSQDLEPQGCCDRLVQTALAAGGYDNVTVLVVQRPGRL